MKTYKYKLTCLLACVLLQGHATEDPLTERKKTISRTYSCTPKDRLYLSNQHGEINIQTWNKNEVRAEITVVGQGQDDDEAQEFVDAVKIIDTRENNTIRIETRYAKEESRNSWWSNNNAKNRGVRITYSVSMPKYMALEILSRFANVTMSDFSAPLQVDTHYGNFIAERLENNLTDISVSYGKANIRSMNEGKLNISYSKLNLETADRLHLVGNYAELLQKEIGDLTCKMQYSKGNLGKLRDNARIVADYSSVNLPDLPMTLKTLEVLCNYSPIHMPVSQRQEFNFDITVKHAGFDYASGIPIFFIENGNEKSKEHPYYNPKKVFRGRVGKGTGGKVRIVSNYGSVRFVD